MDTNVFVYAYATGEAEKRARALAVLDLLVLQARGKISTQVLGELFRVVTTRLQPPRSPADACEDLGVLARAWPVLQVTPLIVLEAAKGVRDHRLNFWDAQLWATARFNQIELVLTENYGANRRLESVEFVNPFAEGFDLAAFV